MHERNQNKQKKRILSSKDFLKKHSSKFEKTFHPNGNKTYVENNVMTIMQKYAKYHMELMLNAILLNAKVKKNCFGIVEKPIVDEVSIITSYSTKNIK